MKNLQTTTTEEQSSREQVEQVAVVQPPKIDVDAHLRKAVADVLETIGPYNERFRHKVLSSALADVSQTTDAADKLIRMEDKIRGIVNSLDLKTKAMMVVLQQLEAAEGETIGVDYGMDIADEMLNDKSTVGAALEEYPDDADLAILSEAYQLALYVRGGVEGPEDADEALEETEPEPDGDEEGKSETTKTEESQEAAGKKHIKNATRQSVLRLIKRWMAQRNYTEKLTAVLLWQLSNKCDIFEKPDNRYHDELFKQWEAEIIEASGDARALMNDNDGLEPDMQAELVAVSAVTAAWIPMEV